MPDEIELTPIFSGNRYTVKRATKPTAKAYVICFEARREEAAFDRLEGVARRCLNNGFNFIGFQAAVPDFYQVDEIEEAIKIAVDATKGFRRVGYGQSMGGFAILNYYWQLKLDHVFAVAPQASLIRDMMPFEQREPKLEAIMRERGVNFDRVFTLDMPPIPSGIIMYDPYHVDREHANLLRTVHPKLDPIPTPFSGHSPVKVMHDQNLSGKWLPQFYMGKYHKKAFMRDWKRERANSGYVWHQASKLMVRQDRIHSAIRFELKAIAMQKNFYEGQYDLANLYISNLEYKPAMEVFGTLIAVPKYREKVRGRLETLMETVPDRTLQREFSRMLDANPSINNPVVQAKARAIDAIFNR